MPEEEVYTDETVAYMRGKGADFVGPDGESLRMVRRRTSGWLEDEIIYNPALASTDEVLSVAVVGHGAASRCLFQYIMAFDDRFLERIDLFNCSISRFRFSNVGWSVICINDHSHINVSE